MAKYRGTGIISSADLSGLARPKVAKQLQSSLKRRLTLVILIGLLLTKTIPLQKSL